MRRGFTVVELLVVIAIIGVITSLTIPAVQMAREASRKTTCSNNLKQLAMAAQSHNTTFEYFPNAGGLSGASRSKTTSGIPKRSIEQDWGVFYQLLPYLEQEALFSNTNDAQVAGAKLKLYFCPTRRSPTTVSGSTENGLTGSDPRGGVDYAGSGGDQQGAAAFPATGNMNNQNGVILPRPNAVPMIVTNRITSQEIADGLSNVVMFGERNFNRKPIGTQFDEDNGFINGWSFDTIRWGAKRPNQDRPILTESLTSTYDYRFGGSHSGVVYLAFCDGSVRGFLLSKSIDDLAFRQLVNRRDGKYPQLD